MSSWQTTSTKVVYENPWMSVNEDTVVMPNGRPGLYGVVSSKSPSVFVVPVDDEGNTYLIQQEHYTTREMQWQCVGGRTDDEPVEVAAKRELLEEAGLHAKSITVLSAGNTAAGMTTFHTTICLANGLTVDKSQFDAGEINDIKKLPLAEAKVMIMRGELTETESIAALLLAIAYLEERK